MLPKISTWADLFDIGEKLVTMLIFLFTWFNQIVLDSRESFVILKVKVVNQKILRNVKEGVNH